MNKPCIVTIGKVENPIKWQPFSLCPASPILMVVRLQVSLFDAYVPRLVSYLSVDELERSSRFARPVDRSRYVIARGFLRFLLARFTEKKPREIAFAPGKGKPTLKNDLGPAFNVSHSGDWILYAFDTSPVGIDVEGVDACLDPSDIVRYYFTLEEQQFVQRNGLDSFYTLWTRKEALIKAIGYGIDENLAAMPSLAGTHYLGLNSTEQANKWIVQSFSCSDQYSAALAFQSRGNMPHVAFYEVNNPNITQTLDNSLAILNQN